MGRAKQVEMLDLLCLSMEDYRMSGAAFDLGRVLSPIEPSRFFSEYWEQRPLVIVRTEPNYYADLFSMKDVDYILSSTDLRYPAIRLVKSGSDIPLRQYATDVPWGKDVFAAVADVDKVLAEYRRGATIIFQALHRSWRPFARFCRDLEKRLSFPLQTNVYLTPPSSQGFAPHYDTHDVFVLQVAGSKHWRIYGSPVPLPDRSLPSSSRRVEIGEPLHELDVSPGDLIYMPRGYIHEGLTSESESLHITVGIPTLTWIDVFTEALAVCQQDVRFRRSLPVGFVEQDGLGPSVHDEYRELLDVFADSIQLEDVVGRIAERFITSRTPLLEEQLLALADVDQVDVHTIVRHRSGLIFRLTEDDYSLYLLFPGKKLSCPKYGEPLLRFIVQTSEFNVASLPGDIDMAEKLELVRRLIREGFLVTVRENE
jgi:ribosomal protein L16 Arg81 hydroxylase